METTKKEIELKKYFRGNSPVGTAYAGRPEGQQVRKTLNLDVLDEDDELYSIMIPNDTTSFNPSFYLGLFFESIKKLGWDKFQKKYVFDLSKFRPALGEVIHKNLEDCERKAKNELNKKTGLDV